MVIISCGTHMYIGMFYIKNIHDYGKEKECWTSITSVNWLLDGHKSAGKWCGHVVARWAAVAATQELCSTPPLQETLLQEYGDSLKEPLLNEHGERSTRQEPLLHEYWERSTRATLSWLWRALYKTHFCMSMDEKVWRALYNNHFNIQEYGEGATRATSTWVWRTLYKNYRSTDIAFRKPLLNEHG